MTKYIIYGLVDPITKYLRYVGKSECGIKRPRQHVAPSSLKTNTYKNNWIKSLLKINQKPEIIIIQEFKDKDVLAQAEAFWIDYFTQLKYPLTNQCRGGEGFTGKHSEESKAKIGAYWKGRKRTVENCLKIPGRFHKRPIVDQYHNVYESTNDAARKLKLSPGNICSVLKGNYKHTGGYIFAYKD